ncbi:hypothetical protein Poli38472_002390 [Pythium oligandrum]|uniref:Uncharacterized protein n=1 Tax=Pythium oligandrum TaxID=41045 RepID=A0A8K1FJS7_PYTOL|nr:hypothetical protein Poli38472_002390 [Pythium oligandrum]|eukprot:TMW63449.1 hypothetical protein Poli38472_002390 [Pythium oligandrum]
MRASSVLRLLVVAATAFVASAHEAHDRHLSVAGVHGNHATMIQPVHVSRVLHKKHHAADDTAAADPAAEEEEDEVAETAAPTAAPVSKKPKKKAAEAVEEEAPAPAPAATTKAPKTQAPAPAPAPAPTTAAAPAATTAAPVADDEDTPAPTKKHKKTATPAPAAADDTDADAVAPTPSKSVNDKRIKGDKNEGVIDGSSEGSAEIDKIDLRNEEKWVSVYNDPPLLVIKASLYAFISYNNSDICDTFNMSLNAVEQKADGNGTYQYHVVTYINCTKNGVDETPGRFILNFIPEGKRLLLTECGHREEGEIVNWLKIVDEVPECMTPTGRKKFLAQPMKHIHANNGTDSNAPKETNFFARLENLDGEEVAIAGSATVALIAVIVVIAVFIMRKRKAQKDLERTIAGAKADHADDDEEKGDDDKNLVDAKKKKSGEDEGSFVNSPAVKV